ncbi:MAG TPA: hypothetical protein VI299_18125 [Polyangiales bacterium]
MWELRVEGASARGLLACMIASMLVLLTISCARAQDSVGYEETIRRALEEYAQSHWEESRVLFKRAHAVNPSARTWRGMGICAFELRQYVAAIDELNAALADFRKPLTNDQRNEAQRLLSRARAFVAVYDVKVKPDNAQILIDGVAAQVKDNKLYVDPGSHMLTIRAADHQERKLDVRLGAGTYQDLSVELLPVGQVATSPADAPATKKKRRIWTWVLGGATVAAGAVAIGMAFGARNAMQDNDVCKSFQLDCRDVVDRGKSFALGTNLAAGLTGALAIGTVVAAILETGPAEEKPRTALLVGPQGLTLRGSF